MAVNSETTARKLVSMPHETVRAIQNFRFANRMASESQAIRRLINIGLHSEPMLRDLLAMMERLPQDPDLDRHMASIRAMLGRPIH